MISPVVAPESTYLYGQYTEATIKTNETHDKLRPGNPYLTAALGHDLLTAEREAELGRRALSGDIEARNALVMHNQRFLLKTVTEFHSRHNNLDFDDLVSEANIGLMRAAEKYDPATGNRFLTYARYWILQSLTRLSDQHSISVSLDEPVSTPSGDEGACLGDLVCPVTVDFIANLQARELLEVIEKLPQRHAKILMHRFGAFGRRRMTLQEIADRYGITSERVRQIESKALAMCRSLGKHIA